MCFSSSPKPQPLPAQASPPPLEPPKAPVVGPEAAIEAGVKSNRRGLAAFKIDRTTNVGAAGTGLNVK